MMVGAAVGVADSAFGCQVDAFGAFGDLAPGEVLGEAVAGAAGTHCGGGRGVEGLADRRGDAGDVGGFEGEAGDAVVDGFTEATGGGDDEGMPVAAASRATMPNGS